MAGQAHGKRFEDFVKACGRFPGSADQGRSPTSGFDIEGRFDREHGLPTSVKTTGNNTVALSDARRFFAIDHPFRVIVGHYRQEKDTKVFHSVHEFVLDESALAELRGEISLATVQAFHEGLLLDKFPLGRHVEARQWAQAQKSALADLSTRITLNPKIDSKSQRRLQCSIRLRNLVDATDRDGGYSLHTEWLGETKLPIIQRSARRKFA